jgi:hypothetical protein
MRSPLARTPPAGHFDAFSLRIKEPARNDAISLSVALKRPDRSFGATADSRASSFTVGSARTYISVVCMLAWPSQRETFRRSLVVCKILIAQLWRNQCGETRFANRTGNCFAAVLTCLRRMYSKPERVIGSPRALRKSSGAGIAPLIVNHERKAEAVSFHNGRQRCLRPFPWMRTEGCG